MRPRSPSSIFPAQLGKAVSCPGNRLARSAPCGDAKGSAASKRDVAIVAGGVRLVDWWRGASFSVELARANHTTAALSSHGQFLTSFGWWGERLTLSVRHVSNADLGGGKNLGETMLLAGVHF